MTESNSLPEPIQDAVAALLAAPDALGPLDRKIVAHFPGLVVRKEIRRINDLKGKTLVTAQFTESDFFIQESWRIRDPQLVRLNFSWRFGKFDLSLFKRKNLKMGEEGGGMEGGF